MVETVTRLNNHYQPSTRAEVRSEMGEVLSGMDLTRERREEVLNALMIGDIPLSDVMVDIDDILTLSTAASLAENMERIHGTPHVRYPLVGDSVEEFEGIVYTPLLLRKVGELEADIDTWQTWRPRR